MKTYQGSLRLVVKNFPYQYRTYAYLAAQSFLAAHAQGKGWKMYKKLLQESPKLDRMSVMNYAAQLGLDMERFVADIDNDRYKAALNDDRILGLRNNVFNTPTFFINGRMVVGARDYDYLKKVVEEELHNEQK